MRESGGSSAGWAEDNGNRRQDDVILAPVAVN
jgi:hypothetical protein